MAGGARRRDPLNGPLARIVAALVLFGVIGLLVYLHRYELFREGVATAGLPPAVTECVETRLAGIDDQIARGTVSPEMAEPMRASVVEFCKLTAGEQ